MGVRRTVRRLRCRIGRITEKLGAGTAGAVNIIVPRLGGAFYTRVVAKVRSILEDRKCTAVIYSYHASGELRQSTIRFLDQGHISKVVDVPMSTRNGRLGGFRGAKGPVMLVSHEVQRLSYSDILMSGRGTTRSTVEIFFRTKRHGVKVVNKPRRVSATRRHLRKCHGTCRGRGVPMQRSLVCRNSCAVRNNIRKVRGLITSGPSVATIFIAGCRVAVKTIVKVGRLNLGVPRRLSVVNFSGLRFTETYGPGLAVITRPARKVTKRITKVVLGQLRKTTDRRARPVARGLNTRVVVKGSIHILSRGRGLW